MQRVELHERKYKTKDNSNRQKREKVPDKDRLLFARVTNMRSKATYSSGTYYSLLVDKVLALMILSTYLYIVV
uniref:Ovule protein n=1 Tax=Heterorhabditis bacteriophora TaxID=37862 RepID=A0A1I7XG07_HETBA